MRLILAFTLAAANPITPIVAIMWINVPSVMVMSKFMAFSSRRVFA